MCGISGLWNPHCDDEGRLNRTIDAMTSALHHRGPDSGGRWTDREQGLALGHRRLAIVDLSPEGHQPMTSACGRFVIVFNGEIYNFEALRTELLGLGHRFRGHSDTEVLLAAIEAFGIDAALERAAGMFAIALWDKRAKRLHLVRDRLGKKPLYYGWIDGAFVFASELKALRVHPGFDKDVSREALTAFLRYQYVPEPLSIWEGIFKLAPGMRLSLDRHDLREQPRGPLTSAMRPYWSIQRVVEERSRPATCATPELALDRLDTRIRQAVKERMVADVPVGAFLSGGVNSSLVTAMMQAQSDKPVNSFTVGFNEGFYNEAAIARQVAQPPRHPPYRDHRHRAACAGCRSRTARDLRRALRRPVRRTVGADLPPRAPPCDGLPVGGWRRRNLLRLWPLYPRHQLLRRMGHLPPLDATRGGERCRSRSCRAVGHNAAHDAAPNA